MSSTLLIWYVFFSSNKYSARRKSRKNCWQNFSFFFVLIEFLDRFYQTTSETVAASFWICVSSGIKRDGAALPLSLCPYRHFVDPYTRHFPGTRSPFLILLSLCCNPCPTTLYCYPESVSNLVLNTHVFVFFGTKINVKIK